MHCKSDIALARTSENVSRKTTILTSMAAYDAKNSRIDFYCGQLRLQIFSGKTKLNRVLQTLQPSSLHNSQLRRLDFNELGTSM